MGTLGVQAMGREHEGASWDSRKVPYPELCGGSLGLCSMLKRCTLDETLIILQSKNIFRDTWVA